jgi:prepilin-type N-terminal cleavage/methylation domain-containing protein
MSARSTCRHEADTDAPCAGFTLVEMLVTLTILVLVMGSLTVSMARRDVVPTPHDKAREIQALLYLARSGANLSPAITKCRWCFWPTVDRPAPISRCRTGAGAVRC